MTYEAPLEARGSSKELIVLIHGYKGDPSRLADIEKAVKAQYLNADILKPRYKARGGYSAFEIANSIEASINDAFEEKATSPYEKVILIGYSMGCLLLRKAYVYGCGSREDDPIDHQMRVNSWVNKVDRIILIAGMNRGWTLEKKSKNVSWLRYIVLIFLRVLLRRFSFVKLLMDLECGSPFVSNLRLQWVRLSNEKQNIAPTIQLLGGNDEFSKADDGSDLQVNRDFIFIPVNGSNHTSLIVFDDSTIGKRSQRLFVKALTNTIDQLNADHITPTTPQDDKHIVFILHGIRDTGEWTGALKERVENFATNLKLSKPEVITPKYGYFPMIDFLLFNDRQKNVRRFMDDYTEQFAKFPHPSTKISFIGHSNGTYMLAGALEKYATIKMHNVNFAGSVVRTRYPWGSIGNNRITKLRNDLAASDWVVAIFPKIFEHHPFMRLKRSDVGSGGFDGFQHPTGNGMQAYYKGGHSAAISPANFDSIARFILTGDVERDQQLLTDSKSGFVDLLSKFCVVIWILIVALLIILGVYLSTLTPIHVVVFVIAYLLLLRFLLKWV